VFFVFDAPDADGNITRDYDFFVSPKIPQVVISGADELWGS
jgi:hypothetical protein